MKTLIVAAVVASFLGSNAAFAGTLVRIGEKKDSLVDHSTPLRTRDGRKIRAQLVRIEGNGTREAVATPVSEEELDGVETAASDFGLPVYNIMLRNPMVVSVTLGFMFVVSRELGEPLYKHQDSGEWGNDIAGSWSEILTTPFIEQGIVVEGEVGLGGAAVKAGYRYQKYLPVLFTPIASYELKASAMRTWWLSDWLSTEAGQTYVGVEGTYGRTHMKYSLAVYNRVKGEASEDGDWLVSGGIGAGW